MLSKVRGRELQPSFSTAPPRHACLARRTFAVPFSRQPLRANSSYFELIRANSTSRLSRGAAKTDFSYFHLISVNFTWFHFPALEWGAMQETPCLLSSCVLSRSFAAIKRLFLRFLRVFAAIQSKCLSMNHLHPKSHVTQSGPIKPNQA